MKKDLIGPMWKDIGPEKTMLLKRLSFDLVENEFVKPGKRDLIILTFEHVRDTPVATLRAELSARAK
jgi:hypothetical protein